MKLIIDISKATQKIIHDHGEVGIHMSAEKLLEAIQDSIPLDTHDELVIETTVKSIWGKPPYTEVLDKIRVEIEDVAFDWQEIDGEHESFMVVDLNDALRIIDKYKAERSEE